MVIVVDFGFHDRKFHVKTLLSPTNLTFRYTFGTAPQMPRPHHTDVDHNNFPVYGLIKA